jgi:hypothetical protein
MGYLIHLAVMENGITLTLFRFLTLGIFGDSNDKEGPFTAIHLGIFKLELTLSIGWR